MLIQLHPDNPEPRKLLQIVECLRDGGTIIYPTDTIYGLGCDIFQQKAIEQICRIKGVKPEKTNFSFICNDLSHITDFTLPLDNATYKLMKRTLPGPYTYILRANNNVPKLFKNNKKTVGIRIPNNIIVRTLVTELGNPILTTSLKAPDDDVLEYYTDPYEIHEEYERLVDIVIDGGFGGNIASTIVDCTDGVPVLLREGAGEIVW
jgi:tRNA threonylcarbamoyl adenosine modification protein (Sua5/YciO/YrdC/YwlC family)